MTHEVDTCQLKDINLPNAISKVMFCVSCKKEKDRRCVVTVSLNEATDLSAALQINQCFVMQLSMCPFISAMNNNVARQLNFLFSPTISDRHGVFVFLFGVR